MTQLFFKAMNFKSNVAIHKLSNVQALIDYEADALAHWVFDKGSSSVLADMDGGNVLSLQQGATINPAFSAAGVKLSSKVGNALMSNIFDLTTEDITLSVVARSSIVSALSMLFGNLPSDGAGPGVWIQANKIYGALKGTKTATASIDNVNINAGDYFFASLSINKTTKSIALFARNIYGQGSGSATYSGVISNSTYPIALGSSHYTSSSAVGEIECAEAVIHRKALGLVEIQSLAERASVRCAKRGIIF